MTQQGTYHELIMLERDINKQVENSPAFAFFNRDRIKKFYSQNKIRLNLVKNKIREMMDEHIKKNEQGEMEQFDNNGTMERVFHTEADRSEYSAKYEALLTRTIDIHC